MSIAEIFRNILAGSRFNPDAGESAQFLAGKGSEADLPESCQTPRVPTDLDEPTTEDIRAPYAPPYDDGS